MDANAWTPRDLFDGNMLYEVPPFQRPYVWTEEDQWQLLWDDIARVAESVLDGSADDDAGHHFLGAVVLKQHPNEPGEPSKFSVVDGQQRLTTLQVLLDAAQLVVDRHGHEEGSESLQELVVNSPKRFKGTHKRFKLWPSRIDRAAFECAMDNDLDVPVEMADSRIVQAHKFFGRSIDEWADPSGDPEKLRARLDAIVEVLTQRLQIVAIGLAAHDDDQLIFETLNDRGTPLLGADLVKNFVFQRCEKIGADVDTWSDLYWQDFDGDWWREQVAQGRLFRSRIDLFLQYWLTMRIRAEIPTDKLFARFRTYAGELLADKVAAEEFLAGLRRDADLFRDLTELDPTSASGSFYFRVVEALELGAFIPLLLWMISENHSPPRDQVDRALKAVESWAVRRTLLRRTMKDVNKLVVALLQQYDESTLERIGDATVDFLSEQESDAREWPTDDQVCEELPEIKVYGNIKQHRLRTVLSALEIHARTARHEEVTLPPRLEIEHIMPRGWRTYWGEGVASDPELSAQRDRLINTVGNLTLVTQKLNAALSNRPWSDEHAQVVAPTGKDAGRGKRSLLADFSVLVLNKEIVDEHPEVWTEADIAERSARLAQSVTEVWPRG